MPGPNEYFDLYGNSEEQLLHDGLVQEVIEIHGSGFYYLPRRSYNVDEILMEDAQHYFDSYYLTTFFIKNVEGFEGQGDFMSKFGLEIRDQITLTVSGTIFQQDVGIAEQITRPREGDLVYFPLNQKVFEIVFVQKFNMYFPLGATPAYDITCQLYEYSGQNFTTGIPEIDNIQKHNENILDWSLTFEDGAPMGTEDGDYVVQEDYNEKDIDVFDISEVLQKEGEEIINWDDYDPFTEGLF